MGLGKGLSRGEAIAAHCYWCSRRHGIEARIRTDACPVTWCALWDYRPRLRPGDVPAAIGSTPCPSGGPPGDTPAGGAITPHPAGQRS
jgi:hypothetical protein